MPPSPQHVWVQINYNCIFMKLAISVSKYTPKRINRNMFSKISSWEIPHRKRVSKKKFLFNQNGNLKKNEDKIWLTYTLKRTKLHRFKKNFSSEHALESPSNASRHANSEIWRKNILPPPLPNPGDAPVVQLM